MINENHAWLREWKEKHPNATDIELRILSRLSALRPFPRPLNEEQARQLQDLPFYNHCTFLCDSGLGNAFISSYLFQNRVIDFVRVTDATELRHIHFGEYEESGEDFDTQRWRLDEVPSRITVVKIGEEVPYKYNVTILNLLVSYFEQGQGKALFFVYEGDQASFLRKYMTGDELLNTGMIIDVL